MDIHKSAKIFAAALCIALAITGIIPLTSANASTLTTITIKTTMARAYSSPGSDDFIAILMRGDTMLAQGVVKQGDATFYKVNIGGTPAYIGSGDVTASTTYSVAARAVSTSKYMRVSAVDTNLLASASSTGAVNYVVPNGSVVIYKSQTTNSSGTWLLVEYQLRTGYVAAADLAVMSSTDIKSYEESLKSSPVFALAEYKYMRITASAVNMRAQAGTSYSVLRTLRAGDVVYAISAAYRADGVWYKVIYAQYVGFVRSDLLKELTETETTQYLKDTANKNTPTPPPGTIPTPVPEFEDGEGLPPPTEPGYVAGVPPVPVITSVEKLEWGYNAPNTVSTLFKNGMTAIVTDVQTGITFTVKRLYGGNHADVETLTKFDTYQLFRCYGMQWSWERRAIWVTVGSRTFAGSMYGFPHGEDSIPDNNLDGQICFHFLGSKTHGSNKVCPDHQRMVEYAYNAWVNGTGPTPPPSTPAPPATSAPTPTPKPTPTATPTPAKPYIVSAGVTALRAAASNSSTILERLVFGTPITIKRVHNASWMFITTPSGKSGYILTSKIMEDGTQAGQVYTMQSNCTALREKASNSTAIIEKIYKGAKLTLLHKVNETWYYMKTSSGKQGFVLAAALGATQAQPAPTTAPTAAPTAAAPNNKNTHIVTSGMTALRASASNSSGILARMARGTMVEQITLINANWVKVKYGNLQGYMLRDTLTLISQAQGKAKTMTANVTALREQTSNSSKILKRLYKGEQVYEIVQVNALWYMVRTKDGSIGYVLANTVK